MLPEILQGLVLPLGVLVIFYLFAIRPQKKKETEIKEMRNALKVGDTVITIGGIHGKVVVAKEDILVIESGVAKTKLEVTRWSVGSSPDRSN